MATPKRRGRPKRGETPRLTDVKPTVPRMTDNERAILKAILREVNRPAPPRVSLRPTPIHERAPLPSPTTHSVGRPLHAIVSQLEPVRRLIELKKAGKPTRSPFSVDELTRKRDQLIEEFNQVARGKGIKTITPEDIRRAYSRYRK